MHLYEVRPRKDHRGVDLIARVWYGESNAVSNAISYVQHRSRRDHAVIRVYDAAGNVIERQEHGMSDEFQGYADDVQARANRHFEV